MYHAVGKQVLSGNIHVADARDPDAAQLISDALNRYDGDAHPIMPEIRSCTERQENDEMVCHCGLRWDVNEDKPNCPRG